MMMKQFGILLMMLLLFGAAHAQVTTTIKDLRVPGSFQLSLNKVVAISKDTTLATRRDNYLPTEKMVKDLIANRMGSGGGGGGTTISGTGFVKASGTTISYDNSTYLTAASITGKLNISDTAAMLTPYRTGMATNTSNIAAKQDTGRAILKGGQILRASDWIGSSNNSSLRFRTNGVERLVVDSTNGINVDGIYFGRGGGMINGNIGIGLLPLNANTTGSSNNAIGSFALRFNQNGNWNNAVGVSALYSNVNGSDNTAIGIQAIYSNVAASNNTGIGANALYATTGGGNVGIGNRSGRYNTTGTNQIFINSLDRLDYTGDQNNSPVYIQQNATVASQNITLNGNVGVNTITPAASALLDITSTSKGLLIPRMTTTNMNAIASPATGLMVYNTTDNVNYTYNGSTWVSGLTNGTQTIAGAKTFSGSIAMGTSTGTGLIKLPDAGTTSANGISFGTGVSLFRISPGAIRCDGSFDIISNLSIGNTGQILNSFAGTRGAIQFNNTGISITNNSADAAPGLLIQNNHASSTGTIATFSSTISSTALTISRAGKITTDNTITTTGTTGAQTINKPSGKVNASAASTLLVVTNNLVTTGSIVMCQIGTNDATCVIKSVVEAAGSFTINYVAPTAETVIKFWVIN